MTCRLVLGASMPMNDGEGVSFRFLAGDTLEDIRDHKTRQLDAVETPIPSWNMLCGEEGGKRGLAKTWTVVVGGMPGSRKSYFALNLAAHAVRAGRRVGAINFEMSMEGYGTRYLAVLTGTPKDMIGWGSEFDEEVWDEVCQEANEIYEDRGGGLITNDATAFTLGHINEAYRQFADFDVDMVVVDYVQLVKAGGGMDMKERAGAVAEALRTNSHRHRMVTLALSQLNRGGSGKRDTQPRMTDLYGGTFWEANANQVVLMDHTFEEKDRHEKCTRTQLILDKNRHGENLVEIPVKWDWHTMRVEEDKSITDGLDEIESAVPPGKRGDGMSENGGSPEGEPEDWLEGVFE